MSDTMTTDELRDWHARRDSFTQETWPDGNVWWVQRDADGNVMTLGEHPFPATLDGAASAMPPRVTWERYNDKWEACGVVKVYEVSCYDNNDEIHDRYLLAKLAWEQEEAS
ncbi:MAG: hypothetical protein ACOYNN_18300 [Terrimicrobiaceae bacterium]